MSFPEVDVHLVRVNGNFFAYRDEDCLASSKVMCELMGQLRGMRIGVDEDGVLNLDSNNPPLPTMPKQPWTNYVNELMPGLKRIDAITTYIDSVRFSARMPDAIRAAIAVLPRSNASSTAGHTAGKDNEIHYPKITAAYLKCYGINPASVSPLDYSQTDSVSQTKDATGGRNLSMQRVIPYTSKPRAIHVAMVERDVDAFLCGAVYAFATRFDSQIQKAVSILARHHPTIHHNNLLLWYYSLIGVELGLMDATDVQQDAAASVFSGAREILSAKTIFKDAVGTQNNGKTSVAFSFAGGLAWRTYSRVNGVPVESQGLGPLQIIPGLAMAAYREPGLFDDYKEVLDAGDFDSLENLIKALFNPQKMFAIKAMTWDLELKELEKIAAFTIPISIPPHFLDEKTAREVALLNGAISFVQWPERQNIVLEMLENHFTSLLVNIFMLADIFGVRPKLSGITEAPMKECPPDSFGFYHEKGRPHKVCLFSSYQTHANAAAKKAFEDAHSKKSARHKSHKSDGARLTP